MISIDPSSTITLCKTPLEADQNNQLTFATASAQESYFSGLTGNLTFTEYTYVRENDSINLEIPYDQCISYNYLYYKNSNFSNKYFYCFITDYQYVNENTTKVFIKTDVYQTWMFQLVYKKCFVEREHVANDTKGLHTIPEGLEIGDMVTNGTVTDFANYSATDILTVVGLSEDPNDIFTVTPNTLPNTYFNGMGGSVYLVAQTGTDGANSIIKMLDFAGKGGIVQFAFLAPVKVFGYGNVHYTSVSWSYTKDGTTKTLSLVYPSNQVAQGRNGNATPFGDFSYTKPSTLGGSDPYTPKNNKMLCWPYTSLNVSNNAGQSVNYRWEDFTGTTAQFSAYGAVCPGLSIKLEPRNYKNIDSDTENGCDYGLTGPKYPILNFTSDIYTNWQTQNGLNLSVVGEAIGVDLPNVQLGAGSMAGINAALGAGLDAYNDYSPSAGAINVIGNIYDSIQQRYKAKLAPDQTKGNINAGDVIFALKHNGFTFIPISCKKEYAMICDQYMSMYGYKVSTVKIPELSSRPNWNYVKTIGCNFEGDIPQPDLQEIRNIFDKGITLWHSAANFENYDVDNYATTR